MFEQVNDDPSLAESEHEVLRLWQETGAFDALRKKNAGGPPWSFLDGPITANNPMGVHHAWGRTYKDAFQRYFAMRGFDQRWQNGFDCQGLWVEVEVEREKGFKSKRDIEAFGVEEFIEACKQRVLHFADVITRQSIRLGMWMDWENSYFTMSDENNYTIWAFLKKCFDRGFIYKGLDSMPWCPRCGTGISEQERREGYLRIEDESVYLRFPLRDAPSESLLIWTTTPWTLAANVAAAVNPDLDYVKVRQGEDLLYLARERLGEVLEGDYEVLEELKGADLVGREYDGPFDDLPAAAEAVGAHRIIAWDEVVDDEGTGVVHIATGCGREDFQLGKLESLPVIAPIDESGIYLEGFGELTGLYAGDVGERVFEALRRKGLFYSRERYLHDYPHCWRCETPLLFRAVDEWYIDMSWREEIAEVVGQIRWIPDFGADQELDWLKNMGDWMISKKRYWGLALPIWECDSCGAFEVIGGHDDLSERAVEGWEEFEGHSPHRPWIDAVKIACRECGETASRIPDVGNPWLDAGIVPYSTMHYNEDREYWARWIPADFVTESFPGQFRNWFYALLAMSTMMENVPPYKTLLGHALVKDEHGEEMHASRGNAIEFNEAADTMSADVMRWMYCRHTPTNNLNFGFAAGKELERKVFRTLWNTYKFFANYAILDGFDPASPTIKPAERPELDRWILSDLQLLVGEANEAFPDHWLPPFMRRAEGFIDELSNWYVRRSRPRFWSPVGEDEHAKQSAYHTLYEVLSTLVRSLAPIVPFLTERIYQNLRLPDDPVSVHLSDYPQADPSLIDGALSRDMAVAQQVTQTAHALREQAGHRVRQPLAELRVSGPAEFRAAIERFSDLVAEELNVKKVTVVDDLGDLTSVSAKPDFSSLGPKFGKDADRVASAVAELTEEVVRRLDAGDEVTVEVNGDEYRLSPGDLTVHMETRAGWLVGEAGPATLALDVTPDEALVREGLARDVVRHIQNLRKQSGFQIQDRIDVEYATDADELRRAIEDWADYIRAETQCDDLTYTELPDGAGEVTLQGTELRLSVARKTRKD